MKAHTHMHTYTHTYTELHHLVLYDFEVQIQREVTKVWPEFSIKVDVKGTRIVHLGLNEFSVLDKKILMNPSMH